MVVASPPGAGKTRLVVHLAEQLNRRAALTVAIATQTRAQVLDVTNRAAAIGAKVALLGTRDSHRPMDLLPQAGYLKGAANLSRWKGVVVATTARWLWVSERDYVSDVCLVDEAWQMTFADLGGLAPLSAQVVLVGDPGQIAPVVTGDSRRWRDVLAGPQRAAPEALVAAYPLSVTRLQLSTTWRLGPQTTALIQPAFYADLPFTSSRPPRHIQLDGAILPELSVRLVTPLAGPGDSTIAATAATRVRELLSGGLVVDGDGNQQRLQPQEIAVITPHVEQASAVAARLADLPGVLIGTANQAQGSEREAVVVIHPLAGYREAPAFAVDPGRLCVALSRHRAHATIVLDTSTETVLRHAHAAAPTDNALAIQRYVLAALLNAT
ncbi:MAG: AAA family ATPase [Chloroflexota bacterium]|nr:AAA family ATPase [Chloroflexota bacterium]